jgi:NAD+ diphosphatase
MTVEFTTALKPPAEPEPDALWFLFQGFRLLVFVDGPEMRIPTAAGLEGLGLVVEQPHYLGYLHGDPANIHCFCGEVTDGADAPPGLAFEGLRPLYARLDETTFWLAGRAVQIVDWARTHRYCSRCGQLNEDHPHDRAKRCPNCGLTSYPRLAPAVIVRVERRGEQGPEILLARAQRFPTTMFSVLAGFVEPGETLEECVRREIWEEAGIQVRHIRYFGSQPWPFPHSLMIAFTAEYDGGELAIDPTEIAEAGWYSPAAMPPTPPPPSIANRLIADWLAGVGRG